MSQTSAGRNGKRELETALQGNPDLAPLEVRDLRTVLQRAFRISSRPFPAQTKARIGAIVNKPHAARIRLALLRIQFPDQAPAYAADFREVDEPFRLLVQPYVSTGHAQ